MNFKDFFTKNTLAYSAYIIALNFLTFLPTLKNSFTNWDDNLLLTKNPLVTNLSWQGIFDIFTSFSNGSYIPLTLLSFTIEFHFAKLNPFLYHFDSLILHITNSLLVFWLILQIARRPLFAFIITLLFSLNPLRVESVAWISARKDLLSSFFFLLALTIYVQHLNKSTRAKTKLTISFLCFILACLAKPQAMILPFILPALDFIFNRKSTILTWIEKAPFFLTMGIFAWIGRLSLTPMLPDQSFHNVFNILDKFFLTSFSIIFYIVQTLCPAYLSCLYPYPLKTENHFPFGVYLAPFIICAILFALWKQFSKDKHVVFATLFFIVTLSLPLMNIPLGGYFANDRYLYLPSIGLFYGLLHILTHYYGEILKALKTWTIILILLYLSFFSVMSFSKSLTWRNDITLWSDALEYNPQLPIAYNNRGSFYREVNETSLALKDFTMAITLAPKYSEAYFNRALTYIDMAKFDLALIDLNQLLKLNPNHIEAYNNRGYIYYQLGDYRNALSDYNTALDLKPKDPSNILNKALCHYALGDTNSSLADFKTVLTISPDHPEAPKIKQKIEEILSSQH